MSEVMERDLLDQVEVMEGTVVKAVLKKPASGYDHGEDLFSQFENLGLNMQMPQTIVCKVVDDLMVAYDEVTDKGNEIGFIAVAEMDGKQYKKKDIAEHFTKGTLKGKIIGGRADKKEFDLELYFEESEIKVAGIVVGSDAMETEIKRIEDEGIRPAEDSRKAIEVMRNNRVGDGRIIRILKATRKFDEPIWQPEAFYCDVNPEMPESILSVALKASLTGHGMVFQGDKSVGKNVCAETVAFCRAMPYFYKGFSAYMSEDDWIGEAKTDTSSSGLLNMEMAEAFFKTKMFPEQCSKEEIELASEFELLKAKSSSVQIIREYSETVRWVQNGGIMMFNEFNMGDPNLKQQFMNPMLDSTRAMNVPGLGLIRLNNDCVLFCSENPGFVGEMSDNAAIRSRLGTLIFPNAAEIEKQLISSLGDGYVPAKYFKACNNYYKAIKNMVGTISDQCLNIRGFKRALEDVHMDIADGEEPNLANAILTEVVYGCPQEDRANLQMQLKEIVEI